MFSAVLLAFALKYIIYIQFLIILHLILVLRLQLISVSWLTKQHSSF